MGLDDPQLYLYMGVDPGVTGSLAIIDNFRNIHRLMDWDNDEFFMVGLIQKTIYDLKKQHGEFIIIRAAIEFASSRPQQSSVSVFKFGTNYGIWRGMLAGLGIPFTLVRPQAWQKGITGMKSGQENTGQRKKVIAAWANRLYPTADLYGPRGGVKAGRGDAVMIAEWLRKN